jgi:hypothetical protein
MVNQWNLGRLVPKGWHLQVNVENACVEQLKPPFESLFDGNKKDEETPETNSVSFGPWRKMM